MPAVESDGSTGHGLTDPAVLAEPVGPSDPLDLSVIVPTKDAAHLLEDCLASISLSRPQEIIVVDGCSTDGTLEIAKRHTERILSDEGRGLPYARRLGLEAATSTYVALVDADVTLPPGALSALLAELRSGGYAALQAGLHSVSGPGYWGRALVHHHRSGRSRSWFGLVTTLAERNCLLAYGFDDRFPSGEDIDLRWRMRRGGARLGVSRETVVTHRFDDTYEAARAQWSMDGRGLARMMLVHGAPALPLVLLPFGGAVRGIAVSLVRGEPKWLPYFLGYLAQNYVAMFKELMREGSVRPGRK